MRLRAVESDTWIVSAGLTPEEQLRKALLASLASIEYALRLDTAAEVLEESEVRQIDDFERMQTAHVRASCGSSSVGGRQSELSNPTACRAGLERVRPAALGSHVPVTTE
jgi:hypothetical protein